MQNKEFDDFCERIINIGRMFSVAADELKSCLLKYDIKILSYE
jgi:hypothetical protein